MIESIPDWAIDTGTPGNYLAFTGDVEIANDGTIRGGAGSIRTGVGNDSIVNTGSIIGDVVLGNGNDVFNTSQGSFVGVVRGGGGNDHLSGNGARNELRGGAGTDTIQAGAGNDVLDGGAGIDTMHGGRGNDTYYVDNAKDKAVESLTGLRAARTASSRRSPGRCRRRSSI